MTDEQPPASPAVTVSSRGAVDLHAPFFRQLESDRGLPLGILSAMAEKESGGNALRVNPDPRSTASGLFQITAQTARAWGLSPDERFDPVKSATVVADTLARRAEQFGIERAIGMHYGGQGTPFTQTVGTSGLSPAQYASDVVRRSDKYGAVASDQTVGFPSPAFDKPAPAPQEQQFYRQYLQSTAPDGSTTIREVVSPSLLDADAAAAAEKQAGYTFTGFVDPGKMAAVPRAAAVPAPPPDRFAEWREQTPDAVRAPQAATPGSSPWLNMIPPALATAGPLALSIAQPEIGIPMWLASGGLATLGGAGGEAIREKAAGEELSPRNIATQGLVSGATDIAMGPVNKYVVEPLARAFTGRLGPVLGATEELAPVLTSKGTTVAAPAAAAPPPPIQNVQLDLTKSTPQTMQILAKQATAEERPAIAAAWVAARRLEAANSGDPITYMRGAYEGLGNETQQALFGSGKGAFERLLHTAWGGTTEDIANLSLRGGLPSAGGVAAHTLGIPTIPGLATARAVGDLSAPFVARRMLVSPGQAAFGAGVSRVGGVAVPTLGRFAGQTVAQQTREEGLPNF